MKTITKEYKKKHKVDNVHGAEAFEVRDTEDKAILTCIGVTKNNSALVIDNLQEKVFSVIVFKKDEWELIPEPEVVPFENIREYANSWCIDENGGFKDIINKSGVSRSIVSVSKRGLRDDGGWFVSWESLINSTCEGKPVGKVKE